MSKFKFAEKAQKFRSKKQVLLERMANNAVYEFKVVAFDRRGLDGNRWVPNKEDSGHQQLVNTGRMRQSIKILRRTSDSRFVGSDVPYAEYHNQGAKHLPQRKFIGNSKELEEKNRKLVLEYASKIV